MALLLFVFDQLRFLSQHHSRILFLEFHYTDTDCTNQNVCSCIYPVESGFHVLKFFFCLFWSSMFLPENRFFLRSANPAKTMYIHNTKPNEIYSSSNRCRHNSDDMFDCVCLLKRWRWCYRNHMHGIDRSEKNKRLNSLWYCVRVCMSKQLQTFWWNNQKWHIFELRIALYLR